MTSRLPDGTNLLILDDHGLFCAGLEHLFRQECDVCRVASATLLQMGVTLARQLVPRVVLPRPRLNGKSPYEIASAIRGECPQTRLLFLDNEVRQSHLQAAVQVGASGYWTKHGDFGELVAAVRAVAAGEFSFCPAVEPCVRVTASGLQYRPSPTSKAIKKLSRRELEVLMFLARGLTVKQCARRMELSTSTIDNHKSRLMRKLDVHKTVDLAVLAMREGLLD